MNHPIPEAIPKDWGKLQTRIENRLGVLPNFFRVASENLGVTANLWEFAQFAYLDNPLPSLFKERLFVYLSRICKVGYCTARHTGFLAGLGYPSGDDRCPIQTIDEIVRLLRRPFPRTEHLERHLSRLASYQAPLAELPKPDSGLEETIFACATHIFLQTPDATRCLEAVKRAFGKSQFEYLMMFLAFVHIAHYWTSVHTELEVEEDIRQLLATSEALAECLFSQNLTDVTVVNDCKMVGIADLKQAEAAMAQMAAIVESSDDAIISKDLNGIITSWNKGAEKLFGYTATEAIGKSVTILIPPSRADEEPRILARLRRGERVDHYETVRRHKDGSEIDISLTVSPIRDKTGKVIGASKIARDITERKRSEIEREELLLKETAAHAEAEAARAEAEAANLSKDEFLAIVSHELRSPLGAILGYNDMLREKLSATAQLKSYCDIIERNAKMQLQLIEDLLDTARIVSGKVRLELRPLDIKPLLADALEVVRPTAKAKGVQLRMAERGARKENAASREEPAALLGDAARLQQIIWNLLSNAIKFTPAGGSVELSTEYDEGHIHIIVSDTGKGIQPEILPHIFERFRQADASGSRRYGGLGLGLALVKHLVELHGGKVEAASEGAGCGSTFIVTLPLATN